MNMTSLTHRVRTACRTVAERAQYVRINESILSSYAASLPLAQLAQPHHDHASHYLGHGEDTVAFFLTLDAINFGSGYFPHLRKRPGMSGYFTVASSLCDLFQTRGPLSAQELATLTAQDCARIFDQECCNVPVAELMSLFATALSDLGRYLLARFEGSFMKLVDSADGSAEQLAQLLIEMPFFNDVSEYGDLQVPFYKRAQLTAADLSIAFAGQGPGQFRDLHDLTIFADNLVPHVLHMDGILQYDEDLAARIEREELIVAGSAEEVEIRACALHVVELLSAELRAAGHEVWPMQLDYLLWNRGQLPQYKARPRHRARTVYY
ncbi:MAG: hypothetical protein FJ026_02210 [Chloroflexi bacterium]|nr:hypothetical protein [Chloroflexota bacterium]